MKHAMYFMSGLPRSGSTVLASILNQNPDIYVTPTSPLSDLLCYIDSDFSSLDNHYTYDKLNITNNVYTAILSQFYNHIEKPYIIDKHRAWCKNIESLYKFTSNPPKILATNRRISEILTSYILLIERNNEPDNFIDNFLRCNNIPISNHNRAEYIWRNYVSDPYESLVFGLTHFRDNIHVVNYDDLVNFPSKTIDEIYDFLKIPSHCHDFMNIENTCKEEKDKSWGLDNLHQIRPKLERVSSPPEEIIGLENTNLYDRLNL